MMATTIQDLPEEILEKIFFNLSPYQEYDVVALVCKQWRRIITGVASQFQKRFEMSFVNKNLVWTEACVNSNDLSPSASFMSPRLLHSVCYNDETRSVYVFGGRSVGSQSAGFNDLWRLNMHTRRWQRPLISGDFPPPKFGCSLESHKHSLILYGGHSMPHTNSLGLYRPRHYNNELHIFDTRMSKWILKPALQQESPPGLYMHGSCVVANQSGDDDSCMLIFGGIKEQGGRDSNEIWCLDLHTFNWWKPTIIGSHPEPRHMPSQSAFKNEFTFSSAVVIVGGSTIENQILSDAWILVRSGFSEWTCTALTIIPGPKGFVPPIRVFKRSAVKVGQKLIFFGAAHGDKLPKRRRAPRRIYPYQVQDEKRPPLNSIDILNANGWTHLKHHLNPICAYVLDVSRAVSDGVLLWHSPEGEDDLINNTMLGPNKPNFHIAVQARGEVVLHGDFPLTSPQALERTLRQSQDLLRSMGSNKWTPLYFLSADFRSPCF